MKKKNFIPLLFCIISAVIIASCGNGKKPLPDTKPLVAVSIFPLYEAASNITGDRAEVFHALPAGSDPHTFEPQPSTALKLKKSDLCVIISEHFDGWMKDYLSAKTEILYLTDKEGRGCEDENPHIWLYPPDMISYLSKIKDALIKISPENREYFEERYNSYSLELKKLDEEIKKLFSRFDEPAVIQWHPAWDRFSEGYGIKIVSTIEKGHADRPGLKRMKNSVTAARESGTRVVILDPRSGRDAAASYLKAIDGIPAGLDPIGGAEGLVTYKDLLFKNAETLAKAFSEAEGE